MKTNLSHFKLAFFCFFAFSFEGVGASDPSVKINIARDDFWSFSLSGERHSFKAGEGYELIGNSGQVSVGYGYLVGRWYAQLAGDIIVGPFNPARAKDLEVDYQGTGVRFWWGYSAQELDLRHADGGYGFVLGLGYSDIVGRSIGRDRTEPVSPMDLGNLGVKSDFSVRVNHLSLYPGFFFCWLKDVRTEGYSSEQLMTRIEGYILKVTFGVPWSADYQEKFKLRQLKEGLTKESSAETDEIFWVDVTKKNRGNLNGYSILITFSALFGA